MKHFLWIFLTFALTACGMNTTPPQRLTVFAAASLADAFSELGANFESAHPGVDVQFNFAGSQSLRTQLEQGALADIFASANWKEMDALVNLGLIESSAPRVFATNQLVVILPAANRAGVRALADLARDATTVILAADTVPAGNYSLQALARLETEFGARFAQKVLENVVSYENDVRQVTAKVLLGEADAGFVYRSDAVAAPELLILEIPDRHNVVAEYPLAALREGNQALAQAFLDYVLSEEGQAILIKWGFSPIQE